MSAPYFSANKRVGNVPISKIKKKQAQFYEWKWKVNSSFHLPMRTMGAKITLFLYSMGILSFPASIVLQWIFNSFSTKIREYLQFLTTFFLLSIAFINV